MKLIICLLIAGVGIWLSQNNVGGTGILDPIHCHTEVANQWVSVGPLQCFCKEVIVSKWTIVIKKYLLINCSPEKPSTSTTTNKPVTSTSTTTTTTPRPKTTTIPPPKGWRFELYHTNQNNVTFNTSVKATFDSTCFKHDFDSKQSLESIYYKPPFTGEKWGFDLSSWDLRKQTVKVDLSYGHNTRTKYCTMLSGVVKCPKGSNCNIDCVFPE